MCIRDSNKTALPNRLYNAAIYGKPMLAIEGTQLAQNIKDYELGLVVNSFEQVGIDINKYLKSFNIKKYDADRKKFLRSVIHDNVSFNNMIRDFIV